MSSSNSNNPNCPACILHRPHFDLEKAKYHPLAGHGVQDSRQNPQWSIPGLKELSQSEQLEIEAKVKSIIPGGGGTDVVWDGFDGILGLTCWESWTPVAFRNGREVAWLCSKCNAIHQVFPRVEPVAATAIATSTVEPTAIATSTVEPSVDKQKGPEATPVKE